MKSLITATFGISSYAAMKLAGVIIYAAGLSNAKALLLLAATGVGACIVAVVAGVGLAYLAKKYSWNSSKLAIW